MPNFFALLATCLQALANDLEMDLTTVHELEFVPWSGDDWWVHTDVGIFAQMWCNFQGQYEVAWSGWYEDYEAYEQAESEVSHAE